MPSVVIRPTPMEYGLHRAEYDEFVVALEAEGIEARIDQPPERRDGSLQHSSVDVAIYLFENAENLAVIGTVATLAVKKLAKGRRRNSQRPERRGAIFDQDAAVVREIVLERDDDDS